jgi:putative phosphoesterase
MGTGNRAGKPGRAPREAAGKPRAGPAPRRFRIGLISDTHGLVRPEAVAALAGVDHIVHAGDIGRPEVLDALEAIAPLTAIRGNVDAGPWAHELPDVRRARLGGVELYVLHDLKTLALAPEAEGIRVVVSGHSHQPRIDARDGVLYVNPGSAGPRRFRLPVTLALLEVAGNDVSARLVPLA